ncbi:MAG TPA: hypothetical protein DIT04_09385 [Dysgonomonas sp.]|nr:hypothetical protein [Dysgonomonas sp.]
MVSLIYTTTRNKKVKVYFDESDQIWIAYNDLSDLLNTTYEEIDKQRSHLLLEDANNPICQEMQTMNPKERYYSLFLIMVIGQILNKTEIDNLIRWYNIMTEEHTIEVSEEFNKNLSKAIKPED